MNQDETIKQLLEEWKRFPKLRFGQFLEAIVNWRVKRPNYDLFYVVDEELVKLAKKFYTCDDCGKRMENGEYCHNYRCFECCSKNEALYQPTEIEQN